MEVGVRLRFFIFSHWRAKFFFFYTWGGKVFLFFHTGRQSFFFPFLSFFFVFFQIRGGICHLPGFQDILFSLSIFPLFFCRPHSLFRPTITKNIPWNCIQGVFINTLVGWAGQPEFFSIKTFWCPPPPVFDRKLLGPSSLECKTF